MDHYKITDKIFFFFWSQNFISEDAVIFSGDSSLLALPHFDNCPNRPSPDKDLSPASLPVEAGEIYVLSRDSYSFIAWVSAHPQF